MGLLAASAILLSSAASTAPGLREAIQAYQNLDDSRAVMAFRSILEKAPPREVAAKAHLYLGLIAFNAIHPDLADGEFRKAIEANPAIDAPPDCSPKARLAFAEARQEVTRELAKLELGAAAPLAALQKVERPRPTRGHVLSLTLGGVAIALGVVAAIGGAQVVSYNSLVSSANSDKGQTPAARVVSAQGSANFWRYGWIASVVAAGGALTASVFTW